MNFVPVEAEKRTGNVVRRSGSVMECQMGILSGRLKLQMNQVIGEYKTTMG